MCVFIFIFGFLFCRACALYVRVRRLFYFFCTRFYTQDKCTGCRVDRQMDSWLLLVLVVAVLVVMGLPARGCQVGGAVSLRISQDPTPHRHLCSYNC